MERIEVLARTIVHHSLKVKEHDRVLITYQSNDSMLLVKAIINEVIAFKGAVDVEYIDLELNTHIKENMNDDIIKLRTVKMKNEVDNYDCFVKISYNANDYMDKNIKENMRSKLLKSTEPYRSIQINRRRWVLLSYPSLLDSNKAHMTPTDFFNFSMNVMTVDYDKMYRDMLPLKELMEKTDRVRITGPGTDLTFSIKGLPAIICAGGYNIPDGECFTAPVRNSVNGTITYNVDSPYQGEIFKNVSFTFKNGKIISSKSNNDMKLKEILNTDVGSRYVGEFSFGLNPMIKNPMGDILYDEKICGSIHFTPGEAYHECNNGNKSNIHWDLVLIQREEFGGGNIYFDDKLIRENGLFVLEELKPLNYKKYY